MSERAEAVSGDVVHFAAGIAWCFLCHGEVPADGTTVFPQSQYKKNNTTRAHTWRQWNKNGCTPCALFFQYIHWLLLMKKWCKFAQVLRLLPCGCLFALPFSYQFYLWHKRQQQVLQHPGCFATTINIDEQRLQLLRLTWSIYVHCYVSMHH